MYVYSESSSDGMFGGREERVCVYVDFGDMSCLGSGGGKVIFHI